MQEANRLLQILSYQPTLVLSIPQHEPELEYQPENTIPYNWANFTYMPANTNFTCIPRKKTNAAILI